MATPAWPPDSTPRLFVEAELALGGMVRVDGPQAHYLLSVMRTKVGDPIKPEFLDGLKTASLISQGDQAYNAGQYQSALNLYMTARTSQAGDQLKAYNGIYLTRWKLNQFTEASNAFGDVVDYGLRRNRLGACPRMVGRAGYEVG